MSIKDSKVTIGMPVYQAEKTLRTALDSLLAQSYTNFELIISDNGSSDETSKICQEYATLDTRIKYVRQAVNIGAARNFEFVLNSATGKYFMWAAHDDTWSADFIYSNLFFLDSNGDYIASICPVRYEDDDFEPLQMGDGSLISCTPERFEEFLRYPWHANSRFYSLFRIERLRQCPYLGKDFFGNDWAVMEYMVVAGKMNRVSGGFMIRGHQGVSNSGRLLGHYRTKWIHWFLPFYELSVEVLRMSSGFRTLHQIRILSALVKINWCAWKATMMELKAEVVRRISTAR